MSATPSTHPEAAVLQGRLAKVIAPATSARGVRAIVQLLNNHRDIGTPRGDERTQLVCELHDALTRMKIRVDFDDLLGAFGAGPWEPT